MKFVILNRVKNLIVTEINGEILHYVQDDIAYILWN